MLTSARLVSLRITAQRRVTLGLTPTTRPYARFNPTSKSRPRLLERAGMIGALLSLVLVGGITASSVLHLDAQSVDNEAFRGQDNGIRARDCSSHSIG